MNSYRDALTRELRRAELRSRVYDAALQRLQLYSPTPDSTLPEILGAMPERSARTVAWLLRLDDALADVEP